jgi:methylphosphotriester-DNA--protein-cysteine methyltransferase
MNPDEGPKLTAAKVKLIKTALFKSKKQPTLKALAKKFKVSDMQIHRIKTGENWGHIKV